MWCFILVIFAVFTAFIVKLKTNDWFNPGTIFSVYWGFVVLMASLKLYDMAETSEKAYFYVFLGVLSFFIGSMTGTRIQIKKPNQFTYYINYSFMVIASLIIIIYSLYRIMIIIKFLSAGNSWWAIRLMSASGDGGSGTLKGGNISQIIYDFIVSPLMYLIVPMLIADLLLGRRKKRPILFGLIAMTTYSIATVSRAIWAFAILYIVFVIILHRHNYTLSSRQKKFLKRAPILIVFIAIIINRITFMRNSEANIFTNAYAYIAGCMPLFSLHLEEGLSDIRTYGVYSLFGFIYPIFFILNRAHIISYPTVFQNIQSIKDYTEIFHILSPNISMNSYTTLFYNFYIDFGLFGILLGSFVFGFLCMKAYYAFKKKSDMRNLVIYLMILQFIFFSVARIYSIYTTRALSFVWLLVMFTRSFRKD